MMVMSSRAGSPSVEQFDSSSVCLVHSGVASMEQMEQLLPPDRPGPLT